MSTKEAFEQNLQQLLQSNSVAQTNDAEQFVRQLFSDTAEAVLEQIRSLDASAEIDKIEIPAVVSLGCKNKQVWVCYTIPVINKEVCIPHYELICD